MQLSTLTQEQRLERAFVEIINKDRYLYLASILMHGASIVTDDPSVPTACTDGRDVMYNRAFLESLTDEELRFLVLHEVYHKLFRHLRTWKHLHDKDHECANGSCDYVINLMLVDENKKDGFAKMPKGGLLSEKYRGMNTQQVFDLLYKEKEEQGSQGGSTAERSSQGFDEHDWEGAQELTDEEAEELEAEVDSALREGAILAGKAGGNMSDDIKELLRPKVNWRKVLRDFATEQCAGREYGTYARPNRRFVGSDIYLPTPVSDTVPELSCDMDTSGSCWNVLPYFLAELKSVCSTIKPHKLHVLFWDTDVVHEEYQQDELDTLEVKHAHGGGGTDVRCVTKYLQCNNIKPTASIVFTDGYLSAGWSEWNHPVLWVIVDNPSARPPVGKYVHVSSADIQ